jgi:hypothetical protein
MSLSRVGGSSSGKISRTEARTSSTVQVEHLRKLPDVFRVTRPGRERFHSQEMLG